MGPGVMLRFDPGQRDQMKGLGIVLASDGSGQRLPTVNCHLPVLSGAPGKNRRLMIVVGIFLSRR